MAMDRRDFLFGAAALGALAVAASHLRPVPSARAAEGDFEFTLSEAEWRARLTPEQFAVLRQEVASEVPITEPSVDPVRVAIGRPR